MKQALLLTIAVTVFSLNAYAQTDDCTRYLELALKKLEEKDCDAAQQLYNVYTDLSHKQVSYVETLIKDCKKPKREKKEPLSERDAGYSEGDRPFILLSGIFAFNASSNPQLSWGLECGLIWGDGFQGGLTFKFRTSFGYYSQKYTPLQATEYSYEYSDNYAENKKIRKDYYNGTVGVLLGSEYIYFGISMGYAYRVFVSPDNSVDSKSLEIDKVSPLKGFAGELGIYVTLTHGVYFSISVGTIRFKYAECVAGLGYRF